MSDRRPENPLTDLSDRSTLNKEKRDLIVEAWLRGDLIECTPTAVRRGVESGTIKGEVVESRFNAHRGEIVEVFRSGIYIVVGPVSDGGSET